ncbi:MAG: translation elongation factor 4, partial [Proteobacteria bacterium]|nr:translation elongation factor 4 [Pseudomonadota bacterium]
MQIHHIRNFSIIAHIDHGKSTIADRIIELCRGLESREMKQQVLDSMEVEQRRGITVKAQTVRLQYEAKDGKNYMLNLIDTPGHADFSYEVSRSLAACEGVILVVDASQGVEAQTLANTYKAIENDLEIVIALNKIDLPTANIEQVKSQIKDVIGLESEDAILVSGKTGNGIEALIESIIAKIPPPSSNTKTDQFNLKAMILDSWYDKYLGIVTLIRVVDGFIQTHQKIKTLSNNEEYIVERVGAFTPKRIELDNLYAGEVGFITSSIKNAQDCKVGDTIVDHLNNSASPLPGFKEVKSMVFCSVYPEEVSEFEKLKVSFERLKLNDSSLHYEIENSGALGFGLRCGFLGLLHLEVVQERLENEFDLNIITTAPSVLYKLHLTSGDSIYLYNPMQMPHPTKILYMEEPWIKATIILPDTYLGSILNLCTEKRGIQEEMLQTGNKVMLSYKLPLNEVVYDFYDKVKSLSKGYA